MAKFITLENLTRFYGKVKTYIAGLGYQTAAQVDSAVTAKGYQTAEDVTGAIGDATADMATKTYVSGLGYQTASQVDTAITGKGYQTAAQVSAAVEGAGHATMAEVEAKGYQTAAQVDASVSAKGYQTAAQVQSAISGAVSSAYKAKGSCAFADLPAIGSAADGDVWNVTDAFTTTADFAEGAGHAYPAGTNVVAAEGNWDALAGIVDTSAFLTDADVQAVTDAEIDALFA